MAGAEVQAVVCTGVAPCIVVLLGYPSIVVSVFVFLFDYPMDNRIEGTLRAGGGSFNVTVEQVERSRAIVVLCAHRASLAAPLSTGHVSGLFCICCYF